MATLICSLAMVALLTTGWFAAIISPSAAQGDVADIVRKAIINYGARELKIRDYRYIESVYVFHKLLGGKLQDSEVYEVIPLGASLFRRHVAHNGRSLSPLEEMNEQKRLERAISKMEESFKKRIENPDAILPEDNMPAGTPLSAVMFNAPFEAWQLDLHSLPDGFSFRLQGEELSEGHKMLVVQGKSIGDAAWAQRNALDIRNFNITLWIDENELEVVKVEAHAKKKGLLEKPEHAVVNPQHFPGASGEAELDYLYESTLWYGHGTVITWEWKKVNGEVWLPANLHVKGKESLERDYPNGDHGSATSPMEQHTTYYDYEKFRVSHRIVPDFTEKKK